MILTTIEMSTIVYTEEHTFVLARRSHPSEAAPLSFGEGLGVRPVWVRA